MVHLTLSNVQVCPATEIKGGFCVKSTKSAGPLDFRRDRHVLIVGIDAAGGELVGAVRVLRAVSADTVPGEGLAARVQARKTVWPFES